MEIVGTIKDLNIHRHNREHFKYHRQEVIIETPGMYPKIVQLNLWGLKIQSYNLSIGQRISAHVNVESKRHHQKWYTTLDIYDIEYLS